MSRMPDVGDVVDDVFRVESELDHGNFGAIYRVHDIVEDRTLALKIQKPGPHDDQEVRQRFEREARLIYSLDHDHVVEVMYYGQTHDGLPYMAMEFLDGTDLKRLLRGGFELNPEQIRRISLETLSALDAAHHIGIVHRDLKPANIFLVDDGDRGHVKVLDFGFAKAQDDEQSRQLTRADTLVGSPAYMAPELVHKQDVGAHSDLYAMGLILAEMITGEKIVQIENIYDTIVFQGSDKPVDLPPEVEQSPFSQIIEKAVRKDLRRRYSSAAEMMEDLRAIGRGEPAANLQSHAEIDTTPPGGDRNPVPQDAETRPRDHGMPSEDELDRRLSGSHSPPASGESRDARPNPGRGEPQGRNPPSGGHEPVRRPSNPSNSGRQSDGMEAVDQTGRSGDRRSSSGGMEPVDRSGAPNESRSSGPVEPVDGWDSAAQETIDQDRPPGGRRRGAQSQTSLLTEIFLGVLLGSVGVAIILFVLMYIYPMN